MSYLANAKRYNKMQYRNCGQSGLKLTLITIELWNNVGGHGLS